jgi:2,3-bisphosphoglycerate-independent phosphoglycerate mutase
MNNHKVILMILDGWGIGDGSHSDVISTTGSPEIDKLKSIFPHSLLLASGENVGLPEGQMGNSEVGHLTIGAGRIIYQDLVRINKAVESGEIKKNRTLLDAFAYAKNNNKKVHFTGLVSDGGVHSELSHLLALCDMAVENGLQKVFIHALTDGRDTDPRSGKGYLQELEDHITNGPVKVASLCGRYYTMDRDKRWERVREGYDLLVAGKGKPFVSVMDAIQDSYDNGITDEFVKPAVMVDEKGMPLATVDPEDVFICFNFRTDRLREITVALTQKDMPEAGMKTIPLHYITLTRYDETFKNVNLVFGNQNISNTMGEYLSSLGKTQLRIAETEKYAHVTFFFSGGREEVFKGEERVLISSPKVATYDLQPEMSAPLVKEAVIAEIAKEKFDFICLNFANGDMVGHTGVYEAIAKAIRTVDTCVGEVIATARKHGYQAMIIADHGNADYAVNPDGSPNTAHSLNPVPCIVVSDKVSSVSPGNLADVAPTLLKMMNIPQPEEMTGKVLVE